MAVIFVWSAGLAQMARRLGSVGSTVTFAFGMAVRRKVEAEVAVMDFSV